MNCTLSGAAAETRPALTSLHASVTPLEAHNDFFRYLIINSKIKKLN